MRQTETFKHKVNGYAADLERVGRKLQLAHEDDRLALGRLAALAHRAGFAWVEHPPYPDGIFVASGPEPPVEITTGPIQTLPPNAVVNWLGILRPDLPEAPVPDENAFNAFNPANRHDGPADRVVYESERCRLMTPLTQQALDTLLGLLDDEAAAGRLQIVGAFDESARNRRRAGETVLLRHQQVSLERLGALTHQAGFRWVKHLTTPGQPDAGQVYASVWDDDAVEAPAANDPLVVDFGLLDPADRSELAEGAAARLCAMPDPLTWVPPAEPEPEPGPPGAPPAEGAARAPAPDQPVEPPPQRRPFPDTARWSWCLTRYGAGQGRLASLPDPACKLLTGRWAGVIEARADLNVGDGVEPWRFEVRVLPRDGERPSIPRAIYEDLANFLLAHLPVGVEARLGNLRAAVPALAADSSRRDLGTEQTFSHYRQVRREAEWLPRPSTPAVVCPCPPWPPPDDEAPAAPPGGGPK
jgi:hypothetical protein